MTDNESQMSCSPKDQHFSKVIVFVEGQCVEIGLFYAHTAHSQVRETSRLYPFRLRLVNSPLHTCVVSFLDCLYTLCLRVWFFHASFGGTERMRLFVPDQSLNETTLLSVMLPPPSKPPPLPLFVHIWCFPPPNQGVKRCCLQLLYVGGQGEASQMKAAGVTLSIQRALTIILHQSRLRRDDSGCEFEQISPSDKWGRGKGRWGSALSGDPS